MSLTKQPDTVNAGTKWTDEEEDKLLNEIANQDSLRDIALKHKRTECAVMCRLKLIAVRMIEMGLTIEEVSLKLNMSIEKIQEAQEIKKETSKKLHLVQQNEQILNVLLDIKNILLRVEQKFSSGSS